MKYSQMSMGKRSLIKELKKLAKSDFFYDKIRQKECLEKYAEIYEKGFENELSIRLFFPGANADASKDKSIYDKYWKAIKNLKSSLEEYYESTDEGRSSQSIVYFVDHIRLAVKARAIDDYSSIRSKWFKVIDILYGFFKIIPEAWVSPSKIVTRSKNSKYLNIDALVLFLFSIVLMVSILLFYIDRFNFPPELSAEIARKTYCLLSPFMLLFSVFWISMMTSILWLSYTKIFKGNATFSETFNFQFYFLPSWSLFLTMGALAIIRHPQNILLIAIMTFGTGFMLFQYIKGLNRLMEITYVKGVAAFLLNALIAGIIIKLFL